LEKDAEETDLMPIYETQNSKTKGTGKGGRVLSFRTLQG